MTGRKSHAISVPKIGALSALTLLPLAGCTRDVSLLDREPEVAGIPITSCSRGGLCQEMPVFVDKLDLLFVIDNSPGMARAQRAFTAQLPRFLDALASGHSLTVESGRFPAARDIHAAVVTSDMGMLTVEQIAGCSPDGGDDGRLQHEPRGEACESGYPPYLHYAAETAADIESLAKDLSCITPVGTSGCDYVQPLQAAFKALMPSRLQLAPDHITDDLSFFPSRDGRGATGRGDEPGGARGFVREDALLGIIVLTDDDDTSVKDFEAFRPATELHRDSEYRDQDPKLRAFFNPDSLQPAEHFAKSFRLLNNVRRGRVVFAAIAGVPAELVAPEALSGLDLQDERARGELYETLLSDERMTQRIDPTSEPGSGNGKLVPSCMHSGGDDAEARPAYPPRRLVEVARDHGPNGVIQSICQDDLAPAFDAIVDRLASQLGDACMEKPLQRRADGTVACDVILELVRENDFPKTPTTPPYICSDREFLKPAKNPGNENDGHYCTVRQLVVRDADDEPSKEGFYYDGFTTSPENGCRDGRIGRFRLTPGVAETAVSRVILDCSPDAAGK